MSRSLFIGVVGIIFVLALLLPAFVKPTPLCTTKACECVTDETELPCNTCALSRPVFIMGVINVARVCAAQEIIICRGPLTVFSESRYFEVAENSCRYRVKLLGVIEF